MSAGRALLGSYPAPSGGGGLTVVQFTMGAGSSGTSTTLTPSTTPTVGNVVVVALFAQGATIANASVSGNGSAMTWTTMDTGGNTTALPAGMFCAKVTSGNTVFTLAGGTGTTNVNGCIWEISGQSSTFFTNGEADDNEIVTDATFTTATDVSNGTATSIVLAVASCLGLSGATVAINHSSTIGTYVLDGYQSTPVLLNGCHQILSSSATQTHVWEWSTVETGSTLIGCIH